MSELNLKDMKDFIKSQTTYDGRISPDYTASFELKRIIDKLLSEADKNQTLKESHKSLC